MIASSHAGPRDGQSIASTIVETASGHSESASALDNPGSGPKTATGSDETEHRQKAIVMSHGECADVHATVNGPWSESANPETRHQRPETESGHCDALHGKLDPKGKRSVKSASGSGHWRSLLVLQIVTDDHALENGKMPPARGQRAQGTPESTMILLPPTPEGRKQPNCPRPQKPEPSCTPSP